VNTVSRAESRETIGSRDGSQVGRAQPGEGLDAGIGARCVDAPAGVECSPRAAVTDLSDQPRLTEPRIFGSTAAHDGEGDPHEEQESDDRAHWVARETEYEYVGGGSGTVRSGPSAVR
jgi:hypothetical protein